MSKKEKLLQKLQNRQSGFTWNELVSLMQSLGYEVKYGDGSRVKFIHADPSLMINLHRPHPGNEIKDYIRLQVVEKLKMGGVING